MVTTDRVRCVRASTSEFEALTPKDGNTLYFVNENGSFSPESMEVGGLLYLGDKLINIVKPNWEAASGANSEVLNKPNIKRGGSSGNAATAIIEGNISDNNARGQYSHAEGDGTYTLAVGAHSEGKDTFALGDQSHIEGLGSKTSMTITGSGTSYTSSTAVVVGDVIQKGSSFARVTAVGSNGSFTVNTSLGSLSSATEVVKIKGVAYTSRSHVEGLYNNALGGASHAEGSSNYAIGAYSHVEGNECRAVGSSSHAEGTGTSANGSYSHSEGYNTSANGTYAHAEGRETIGEANYSHAEGYKSEANGAYSHAEGYQTKTTSNHAHAEGYMSMAVGVCSHSEGDYGIARGQGSHSEGYGTRTASSFTVSGPDANGVYTTSAAHGMEASFTVISYGSIVARVTTVPSTTSFKTDTALGELSEATIYIHSNAALGTGSHVEGGAKIAISSYSHAEGEGTVAYNPYEHAEGRYNVSHNSGSDDTRTRHSVGIGTGTGSNRKNAVEVMANGDYYLYNVGGYDGKTVTNKKTLQTVLSEHDSAIERLQEGVAYFDRVKVGARGLLQNTLCAFNIEEELVSLVYPDPKGGTEPVANTIDRFPHGAKIYYYAGSDVTGNTNAYGLSLFATFKHADMRKMLFGATTSEDKAYIGATQSTAYVNQSALFLNVDADRYGWYIKVTDDGEMVVPYKYLEYGQTVIRLGCHNASATTDTDWYSMNLEDNNPMYRYEADDEEDPVLTEYHQAVMFDMLGDIESLLAAI